MRELGTCPDCGSKNIEITSQGICTKCRQRKINMRNRGKEYVPYKDLDLKSEDKRFIRKPTSLPTDTNNKDNKNKNKNKIKSKNDKQWLTDILTSHGCTIKEDTLSDVLDILLLTDKIKDILGNDENKQAMIDLEDMLNIIERKLQHNWEFNTFSNEDEAIFKEFLTHRRVLKAGIFFWKKLENATTIIDFQKTCDMYRKDPNTKMVLDSDTKRLQSPRKRYQVSTYSISNIYNTRKPFTRIFYARSEEDAHAELVRFLSERNLIEDTTHTSILELASYVNRNRD